MGARILFLVLSTFVLMNALYGLDLQILKPGGHMEPVFAEPEEDWLGLLLFFAHLQCFYFSAQPASSCPPGSALAE